MEETKKTSWQKIKFTKTKFAQRPQTSKQELFLSTTPKKNAREIPIPRDENNRKK